MGYIGNDGSELVGGLNPSNVVQAFKVDGQGNLNITQGVSYAEQAALTAGSLNADLLPSTDVSAYKMVGLQVAGTWSGTLTAQVSNDNTTFYALPFLPTISANGVIAIPCLFRYLRVRMTAYVSGTATGIAELYAATAPYATVDSAVAIANAGVPVPPAAVMVGGTRYDSTLRSLKLTGSDELYCVISSNSNVIYVDPNGYLGSINDGVNSTAVAAATAANTVIKNSKGRLARILITATGTANVLIYDNSSTNSGTIIGIIKSSAVVGDVITLIAPAANGITIGGSVNNAGFTVFWY